MEDSSYNSQLMVSATYLLFHGQARGREEGGCISKILCAKKAGEINRNNKKAGPLCN